MTLLVTSISVTGIKMALRSFSIIYLKKKLEYLRHVTISLLAIHQI
ncbi:hypothetical protein BV349_05466 [Pseudomonas syringae pv. actinidiae]|nr:hypothetical protein BV349_05466 [Pseudomonas syringae pv. actinidiae]